MTMHAEHSPDESVTAAHGSHVNVNRFSIPRDPRELIYATILALSVLVNVACFFVVRYETQERDLQRYEFSEFERKDFAPLRSQVDAQDKLIQAYGLNELVKHK